MAITIVALNKNFSKPRLVNLVLPCSLPKALPKLASERCRRIATTNTTERTAWMYGSMFVIYLGNNHSIALTLTSIISMMIKSSHYEESNQKNKDNACRRQGAYTTNG